MNVRIPYFFLLGLVVVLASLHFTGTYLYLYWRLSVFDRVVHMVGGFFVAYASLGIVCSNQTSFIKKSHAIMLGVFAALIVGLAWELFELQGGITSLTQLGYWQDTGKDIISDSIGGCLAAIFFMRIYTVQKPHES